MAYDRRTFTAGLAGLALCATFSRVAQAQQVERPSLKLGVANKAHLYYLPLTLAERRGHLGLLDLWIKDRPRVVAWWALAREWPSFKTGLRDLISEAEFSEMRTHGPKIADDVAEIIAEVRRDTPAAEH
jgi:hypothetical protein